jgi:valyl-tRNA synthetase
MRLLTTPVRLTGPLVLSQLVVLVTADEQSAADDDVDWQPSVLAGDLAGQYAAERELAKAGYDRATLDREAFIERVRGIEADRRHAAAETFGRLGLHLDLDAGAVDRDDVVRAARTAFVQLFEQGLLQRREEVVDTCPRCATVVDPADALPTDLEGERLMIDLGDGLVVPTMAPELLPGVVAVVAETDRAEVHIPLADRSVPVIPGDEPCFVVPAHDPAAFDLARAQGLFPIEVLNDLGEVSHEGPLHELPRYAARQAARDLLATAGVLSDGEPAPEAAARCRRCGTVVVPRLGAHWFLDMTDLEVAAADQLREGVLDVAPLAARDELLDRAGAGGTWCLSHQVWAGTPVPVSRCMDCGQPCVTVEQPTSCNKCMGQLAPDDSVLDARFVGAIWPLAVHGWPDALPDPDAVADTTVLTTPAGLIRWALPMAALGLRLAGTAPFAHITAVDVQTDPADPDPHLVADLDALIEADGAEHVRDWLLHGAVLAAPA